MSAFGDHAPILNASGDLDSFGRPFWLLNESLDDHVWQICLDDPTLRRGAVRCLYFNSFVAYGGRRLTDSEFNHDLLSAKLLILSALSGPNAWITTADTAAGLLGSFYTFLQWRNARGIYRTQHLEPIWLQEYVRSFAKHGTVGLTRSDQRVFRAINDIDSGLCSVNLSTCYPGHKSQFVASAVFGYAGLHFSARISAGARNRLYDWAKDKGLRCRNQAKKTAAAEAYSEPKNNVNIARAVEVLAIWDHLYKLRGILGHDFLQFQPFENEAKRLQIARSFTTKRLKRTPTAPAYQTCYLIDQALRWVLLYASDLKALTEQVITEAEGRTSLKPYFRKRGAIKRALAQFQPSEINCGIVGAPWPIQETYTDNTLGNCDVSLKQAIHVYLPAACAIVIATFSARRAAEIESLRSGSITEDRDGLWLETYIVKTVRGTVKIPITQSVSHAINVLECLSKDRREATQKSWLFEFENIFEPDLSKRRHSGFEIGTALKAFARFVKVPSLEDGTQWEFSPHQFRRFFSVMYFYRYKYRSLTALSSFLKHSDPEMTRTYITEAAAGGFLRIVDDDRSSRNAAARLEDFKSGAADFRRDMLTSAHFGKETMTGFGGDSLRQELQRLVAEQKARVTVGSDDEGFCVSDAIDRLVEVTSLEPNPMGHSYCKCTSSSVDSSVAACGIISRKRGYTVAGKDIRFASDIVCSGCPHNVQFSENRAYWENILEASRQQVAKDSATIFGKLAAEKVELATAHIQRCFEEEAKR